ncbi:transmembrane and coiled-coil domain-containing protein 3 isoform X1 [Pteropus alecto]|uniref:transmembrane and coiled-coil domain-containing protein 3 isoform X1 n=1 Tax=Pteropus alecto TaxID=9402 RepID=UPI0007685EC2|nr:transmembrane and coiled-coil domain-containing protein 3 isoform X1 [Pteropus alecto]XP_015442864.1 transmembrane and coiled-coil domain-containing protein 3 isoform X1 [Pteropus alecto]XP_015442865.1 transmembrane and coiled-coil domain-containing protein 3 isoform X1 [Pteropus alecto]XP_015442867.1 transmembrane and coiled-coil domain-containing protein 3 isoform X1 [Pteropus alecto]XP_024900725.1 transmembrane and coiled-coil domain-containing protein 3 isoform X1 [Pteropus alecto]XP_02
MKVLEKNYFWVLLPLLHLIANAAEHEEVAKHAIKLHRGKGAAITQKKQWVLDGCRKLSGLLRQKTVVLNKLKNAIRAVEKDVGLSDEEKLFQVHTFEIFQKELNESENSVFQAIHGLQRALQGDYKDVVNMKESSRQRLEALREAAIKEETEYVELLAAEKHQVEALKNMQHQNKSLSMLDEILEDVRKAADRLEEEIEEHAFDDNKSVKGVNFEAVLRVEEEEANSKQNLTKREVEDDLGLSMLIDSQNNQYILTKPRDATIPRADHHFIKDIVTIGMLSLPCGWLCTTIGLPTMFGYIICGVLLGPSGLNSIKSIVQVETLGEFGVFFTLFLVGLEFSPEKLRKVWKISLQGPCYMTLLMIAFGLLWGHLLQIRPTQSVFISTCLSLSSTPLVSRFLVGSARGEKEAGDLDYSAVLLGMLVMQDVQLGLFIAVMPTLIQAGASSYSSIVMEILRILVLIGQILFSLAAVFLLCLVIKTYLIGPYYRKLHMESKGNKEILILGISAFIFLMLTVTELLDVSMELGCFLAGALISSQGHMVTEEIVSYIEPIRDFLAIIFFASIGLHVFPTFVVYELTVLMVLTLSVVIMKFVLAALVLSLLLPKTSQYIKWIVAAGLAQVSEFSFVLGSRARRAGIISREVYLLILSVTTLSLLLAPVLWRAAIMKCVPRPERRSSL